MHHFPHAKKSHGKGTDKQTQRRTSRLYDWIGPVGWFDENALGLYIFESLRQETKILFEKSEFNFSSFTWSSLCSGKMNLDLVICSSFFIQLLMYPSLLIHLLIPPSFLLLILLNYPLILIHPQIYLPFLGRLLIYPSLLINLINRPCVAGAVL